MALEAKKKSQNILSDLFYKDNFGELEEISLLSNNPQITVSVWWMISDICGPSHSRELNIENDYH